MWVMCAAQFLLMTQIFSGTHPCLTEPDPKQHRLAPVAEAAVSSDEEAKEEVAMEFNNRGCDRHAAG